MMRNEADITLGDARQRLLVFDPPAELDAIAHAEPPRFLAEIPLVAARADDHQPHPWAQMPYLAQGLNHRPQPARDLEDLIPVFMDNRKKELDTLKVALASADFEQLRQLGHRMKGVGNSYGFEHVSTLGKHIEDGARSGDRASLQARIAEYADYLAKVQIKYE